MIKGLNYAIDPIDNQTYRIHAKVKRKGKQFPKQETFTGTKNEAIRRAEDIVRELLNKAESQSDFGCSCSLKTFGECIEYYEQYHGVKKQDQPYFSRLKSELSSVPMENLNQRLNQFVDYLGTIKSSRDKPYSNATKNRFQTWARTAVNFCVDREMIVENPLKKPKLFKEVPRTRIIRDEEIIRLYETIKLHRPYLYHLVLFAVQIPTRKSALVNMRRSWVDIEAKTITIPPQFTKHHQHDDVKPIPPNMVEYFNSIPNESEYAFYRMVDGVCKPLGDFKKAWLWCVREAGIDNLTFHDTRHHSASQLLIKGVPERVVMQVGNWKSNMFNTYYNCEGARASAQVYDMLGE